MARVSSRPGAGVGLRSTLANHTAESSQPLPVGLKIASMPCSEAQELSGRPTAGTRRPHSVEFKLGVQPHVRLTRGGPRSQPSPDRSEYPQCPSSIKKACAMFENVIVIC